MIKIIKLIIHQHLFVKLLISLIFMIGIFTLTNLNREAIPEVNFDMVTVLTVYPGGSPDELEQLISIQSVALYRME